MLSLLKSIAYWFVWFLKTRCLVQKKDFVTINHAKCYAVRGVVTVLWVARSFDVFWSVSEAHVLGVFSLINASKLPFDCVGSSDSQVRYAMLS